MEEKKKSNALFYFVLFLVTAIVVGCGYYFFIRGGDDSYTELDGAIELEYFSDIDEYELPFGRKFNKDVDHAWVKIVGHTDTKKSVEVFDKSSSQTFVKEAKVYDETGENVVAEMPQQMDGEKPFRADDIATPEGTTLYVRIEFGEHATSDLLLVHIAPEK